MYIVILAQSEKAEDVKCNDSIKKEKWLNPQLEFQPSVKVPSFKDKRHLLLFYQSQKVFSANTGTFRVPDSKDVQFTNTPLKLYTITEPRSSI